MGQFTPAAVPQNVGSGHGTVPAAPRLRPLLNAELAYGLDLVLRRTARRARSTLRDAAAEISGGELSESEIISAEIFSESFQRQPCSLIFGLILDDSYDMHSVFSV